MPFDVRQPIPVPPIPSGRYVFPVGPAGSATSGALGNGTLRVAPFYLPYPTPIVALVAEVTVVGEAGSVMRLGVYADNGAGAPGALVVDAGTIPGDAVATAELATAMTLPAGVLYIGGVVQAAPTTQPTVRTVGNVTPPVFIGQPASFPAGAAALGYSMTAAGALPGTFAANPTAAGTVPRVYLRT